MLRLTATAASHLAKVRHERGISEKAAARFVRKAERVALTFALKPREGDTVVDAEGVRVFVAPEIAPRLDEAVVDARRDGDRTVLVFRRGAASQPRADVRARSGV